MYVCLVVMTIGHVLAIHRLSRKSAVFFSCRTLENGKGYLYLVKSTSMTDPSTHGMFQGPELTLKQPFQDNFTKVLRGRCKKKR